MSGESAGSPTVETELDRDIGIVGAVALGVGTMIAAGIFVLSGLAVSNVGAMAITAFLVAAVVASFTAFAYAEFAAIYPESGGGYAYVANTFDSDLTYIVGWSMILGYPASAAFYLASFSDWFYRFMYPAFDVPQAVPYWLSGLVILIILGAINLKGTEESGKFQIVVTAIKVGLIVLFLYGGLQAFDAAVVVESFAENSQTLSDFRNVGLTSALVFITFFGFEAIATNAEEIEDPGRNVPRAIFVSMGFVTLIYTLVVLVVVVAVNDGGFIQALIERQAGVTDVAGAEEFIANNGEVSMGRAAQYYLGDAGFFVIIVGALFSMLSAANATILAGSRVKLAMSRRGHLPDRFESLHPTLNTPYNAVLLTTGLIFLFIALFSVIFGGVPGAEVGGEAHAAAAAGSADAPGGLQFAGQPFGLHLGIEAIAHFADFMLLVGLIVVNVAIVRSRQKYPDIDRPFTMPGVPYVPVVAVLANLVLIVNVEPIVAIIGILAELIGVALWFGYVGKAPSEAEIEREAPTVVEERPPADRDYRMLVPIANPDHAEQLMQTACDIAADRGGEVLALSIVPLPDQTPLSEGEQFVDERREVLEAAMEVPGTEGTPEVPVSGLVRIAHHVDQAILHTIDQHDCDTVLMGWSGRKSRRRDIVLGSYVDVVATEADADVLVERIGDTPADVDSILVPSAGGAHGLYAAEVAGAIARSDEATVTVASVVGTDDGPDARETARATIEEAAGAAQEVTVERQIIESDDVVEGILEAAPEHDLIVVGATREGLLEQIVFGTIPEAVGERAACTTIMAKRNLGVTSRLKQLLIHR